MKEKIDNNSRSLKWEQNGELAQKDLCVLIRHFAPILGNANCYQFFLSLFYLSIKNIKRKQEKFGYCFKPKLKKL